MARAACSYGQPGRACSCHHGSNGTFCVSNSQGTCMCPTVLRRRAPSSHRRAAALLSLVPLTRQCGDEVQQGRAPLAAVRV
jgi:hypothetical protein